MRLHLVASVTASGEIRTEYIGPDRLAAQAAYASPSAGAVRASLYSFLEATASKAIAIVVAPEPAKAKK